MSANVLFVLSPSRYSGGGDGLSAGRTALYMLCIVNAVNIYSPGSLCGLPDFLNLTL